MGQPTSTSNTHSIQSSPVYLATPIQIEYFFFFRGKIYIIRIPHSGSPQKIKKYKTENPPYFIHTSAQFRIRTLPSVRCGWSHSRKKDLSYLLIILDQTEFFFKMKKQPPRRINYKKATRARMRMNWRLARLAQDDTGTCMLTWWARITKSQNRTT